MKYDDLNINAELKQRLKTKLKYNKIALNRYLEYLIKKDLDSVYNLIDGYFFDKHANKLYKNSYNNEIYLTKKETLVFRLLIDADGNIVPTEVIIDKCWETSNKNTIFALRNMIKQIREKTFYDILNNHSSRGYSINSIYSKIKNDS